jgi:Uri superfamily endonuclease
MRPIASGTILRVRRRRRQHQALTSCGSETITVTIAGWPPAELPAGRYLYCVSAKGPEGLRSRLARHMRRGKPLRWHIDQLTERGAVTGIWVARDGQECDLVAMLALLPMPIQGFGSSDCARCYSHLLYWPAGVSTPHASLRAGKPRPAALRELHARN